MGALYGILCIQVIATALLAGWELKPGIDGSYNTRWAIFWLLLSIVSLVLVLATRDVFVKA